MALTTEQPSTLEAWLNKRSLKILGAIVAAIGTGLSVYLPKDQTTRLLLLCILALGTFLLSLILRAFRLEREVETLKISPSKTPEVPDLNEMETSVLCLIADNPGWTSGMMKDRLHLDHASVIKALEYLKDLGFVHHVPYPDYEADIMYDSTPAGRQWVREFRKSRQNCSLGH